MSLMADREISAFALVWHEEHVSPWTQGFFMGVLVTMVELVGIHDGRFLDGIRFMSP